MASPATLAILPMQDVLGLDGAARMNTPGTIEGNWRWRLMPARLDAPARWLQDLAATFGRTSGSTDNRSSSHAGPRRANRSETNHVIST
jgi:4-alpha-glucanotransferase